MKNMLTNEICSTRETFLDAPEWIDSNPEFCCEKRLSDTVEKLMTTQDSLRVAAVRCKIETAVNFNECKNKCFYFINYF